MVGSSKPSNVKVQLEADILFTIELDEIVSRVCPTQDLIDNALRSFLAIATISRGMEAHCAHAATC
jgi:hypothetical protein